MEQYKLSVKRVINAPVAKVFEAWANQEQAKNWLSPEGMTVPEAEIEPKVGGKYRIHMLGAKGNSHITNGTVQIIEKNKKLVFTWFWEDRAHGDGETRVTLDFVELDQNKTELTLTHEFLSSEESKNSHTQGWESVFNRLEQYLKV